MINVTVKTREGKQVELAFDFPQLATLKEVNRLYRAGDLLSASEVLYKHCACIGYKELMTDSVIIALSESEELVDLLMKKGTVVFQTPSNPSV